MDYEDEEWRDVVGYDGYFQVSNMGRVRGVKRKYGKERVLSPATNKYRYKVVCLCVNYVQKTALVHQLVMDAFVGKTPEGLEINHKNGDKGDNRLENLEFCTPRENMLHSYRELGRLSARGERNGMAKIAEEDVVEIKRLLASGEYSFRSLATMFGLSPASIADIKAGRTWRHI